MPTKVVDVGTSVVELVEANDARTALLLANPDNSAVLYISDEAELTVNNGFPLFPQAYILLCLGELVDVRKKLYVISSKASKTCRVMEYFLPRQIIPPTPLARADPPATWAFNRRVMGVV